MKIINLLLGAALCCSLSSCFKDEPLNAECDIEQAYVHLEHPTDVFFAPSDTLINVISDANDITFEIKENADVSRMAPIFRITEGSTISPANGSEHDFSNGQPVVYTVTSQDGSWQRTYNVSFRVAYNVNEYDFENTRLKTDEATKLQYYEWSDLTAAGEWMGNWATGNSGYSFSAMIEGGNVPPEEYPSSPINDGHSGKGVKLVTKDTGGFGLMFGMGIAAGNLFIGEFDPGPAVSSPSGAMQATMFGRPFSQEPLQFTGWYKYKSAGECVDGHCKAIPGTYDKGDIYAVLYRNQDAEGNAFVLHGDDVKTSPQIVAMAQVPEIMETDEWTEFIIDFEYRQELDPDVLANRGYSLAVVCTSSIEGASFRGAIGSTLCVDELKVICADNQE